MVVASPAYLRGAAKLKTPDDLIHHDCVQYALPSTGRNLPWLFKYENEVVETMTSGGYTSSGDVLAGATLARHGAGLFQTYRFIVEKDIAAERSRNCSFPMAVVRGRSCCFIRMPGISRRACAVSSTS